MHYHPLFPLLLLKCHILLKVPLELVLALNKEGGRFTRIRSHIATAEVSILILPRDTERRRRVSVMPRSLIMVVGLP
jgi:hypothetical protein